MIIHAKSKDYEVNFEQDFEFVKRLISEEKTFIIVDLKFYTLYKSILFNDIPKENIYLVESIETNKTIEEALEICEIMTKLTTKRNTKLLSFGGGIIQDITGFVSNVLYRGIHWTFVPTTLLAACDSCIGGKTSLNYKSYKNLLGTFYPPDSIYICSEFFKTLSDRDYQSGLGEVVKFNIMYGEKGILRIEDNIDLLLERIPLIVKRFVEDSLLFKKTYIEEDEFDRGIRIQLNFAHTFGHAFETISNYQIPHGTAVAMGTIVANRISLNRSILDENIVLRIENVLWKIIHVDSSCLIMNMDGTINAIHKDKKQVGNDLTAVLLDNNMNLNIVHDVQRNEIEQAISYLFNRLSN